MSDEHPTVHITPAHSRDRVAHERGSAGGARCPAGACGLHLALIALTLAGCGGPAGGRDGGLPDARAIDGAVPLGDGGVVTGEVLEEICTNGIDEDRNGSIDDGCPCVVGTRRACWPGPPDMRSVGACSDGEQTCDSDGSSAAYSLCMGASMPGREIRDDGLDNDCNGETDEPGGICVGTTQTEVACDDGRDDDCDTAIDCDDPDCAGSSDCTSHCNAEELVCWGGVDDDCDGSIDCDDPDCASDPSCGVEDDCLSGQVRTYRERRLDPTRGGSSIATGDGAPPTTVSCEDGTCPEGQVQVISGAGVRSCAPPPPACPDGRFANYAGYARWECRPPCEIIVHYGGIYGGQNVCTERPRSSCPSGQSPTFVYETQTWVCRPTCNNTLYDQIVLEGQVVCIPC